MNDNINDEFVLDFDDVNNVGSLNFNDLINRPKYNGQIMSSETNIPEVKTYEDFIGTDGETDGTSGLVPAPKVGDENKFLKGDGTWGVGSQYELPVASGSTLGGIKVGNNLTIDPTTGVLDASGTAYTAGAGLDLTGTEFSVDTSTIQPKLTAGSNITIDANNEISATDTTYTAGNAIDITSGVISADIYPADYFTAGETVTGTGSSLILNGTIEAKLNNIELLGDTEQTGEPSPNNPQDTHVVTGEQTVTVNGKNLFDENDAASIIDKMYINANSSTFALVGGSAAAKTIYIPCLPNTTYTVSKNAGTRFVVATSIAVPQNGGQADDIITNNTAANIIITTGANAKYLVAWVYNSTDTGTAQDMLDSVQIEHGSTATDYQPYQSQTYTVNLGSVELAKIGNYQDKIYKSSDKWYVHKEIGKSSLGDLNWNYSDTGTANIYRMYTSGLSGQYVPPATSSTIPSFKSTHFIATNANDSYSLKIGIASNHSGSAIYCYDPDYNTTSSPAGFKTWLSNNDVTFYYALTTPTDTEITDTTLISQLEALYNATSYEDQTNFEVTATSPNMPAILGVNVYKKSLEGTLGAIASKPNQDTTYSNFTGATSNTAGAAGLVPAPTTSDKDKYLKGDGTWGTVNAGPTVVQTTGSSTTDVMSQNAVTTELGNKEDKGLTASIGVDVQDWNDELGISPYTKSVDKAWLTPLSSASSVELINDNPALFAKYGFAIQSVNTTTNMIKIISIGAPDTTVILTINVK